MTNPETEDDEDGDKLLPDVDDDEDYGDPHDQDNDDDRSMFADPGGRSALRAETESNPRNLPCPNCGTEDVLTPEDRRRGYQCDACSEAFERGGP